ncbi:hypothetical protein BDW75DRAFT_91468 [Aspergillus navahoensis]
MGRLLAADRCSSMNSMYAGSPLYRTILRITTGRPMETLIIIIMGHSLTISDMINTLLICPAARAFDLLQARYSVHYFSVNLSLKLIAHCSGAHPYPPLLQFIVPLRYEAPLLTTCILLAAPALFSFSHRFSNLLFFLESTSRFNSLVSFGFVQATASVLLE